MIYDKQSYNMLLKNHYLESTEKLNEMFLLKIRGLLSYYLENYYLELLSQFLFWVKKQGKFSI